MEIGNTALALYAVGAAALATSLLKLKTRLRLSHANHRSLGGHARLARRIASLVPFYAYDEARFFRADDPPEEIAALPPGSLDVVVLHSVAQYLTPKELDELLVLFRRLLGAASGAG